MRILLSILIALIVPVAFWLGGFNFDERGPFAAICFFAAIAVFTIVYACPSWPDNDE